MEGCGGLEHSVNRHVTKNPLGSMLHDPADNWETAIQIRERGEQKVPGNRPALKFQTRIALVAVVIVVVPVAIRTPAVAVFIPPTMAVFPAPGAGLGQFVAILRGLRAVPSMVLCGFMEFVVRADNTPLTVFIRA
jgi:hypothetical protein